jgi:trehalose 6-phosphate synthase/phosphatase
MNGYVNKTEGSYIEVKESSIIWNYKNTDLEFGQMQAKELNQYISNVFEHLPIDVIETKTYVQVVQREMKKEKFIKALVDVESKRNGSQEIRQKQIDFILYIGDDG